MGSTQNNTPRKEAKCCCVMHSTDNCQSKIKSLPRLILSVAPLLRGSNLLSGGITCQVQRRKVCSFYVKGKNRSLSAKPESEGNINQNHILI